MIKKIYRLLKRDNNSLREEQLRVIANKLNKGYWWLDVGCGSKRYKDIFNGKFTRYIGMDLPNSPVERIHMKKPDIYADAGRIPFKEEVFGAVICTHVLEHIFGYENTLKEVSRVLKNSGYFILISAFLEGGNEMPRDYFRFTKYGISRLLAEHGFKIQCLEKGAGFWGLTGDMIYWHFRAKMPQGIAFFWHHFFKLIVIRAFLALDRLDRDESFAQNYIVLAKKA